MIYETLGDRQKEYEKNSDFSLTRRLPVIIRVDGRSFERLTRKLTKPFCLQFSNLMAESMMYSIMEIQGAVFGFQHHDEINLILKTDQLAVEPWYQNRIQKIVSITASLVTMAFNRALGRENIKLETIGDAIFDARTFILPNFSEVVNYLVWRQQECFREAITSAVVEELTNKFGKQTALKLLYKKNIAEKKDLLIKHSGFVFDEFYPSCFRKGIAAYKVPILSQENGLSKNKWILNDDLPFFTEEKDFVYNILLNGHDVFRAPNIFNENLQ